MQILFVFNTERRLYVTCFVSSARLCFSGREEGIFYRKKVKPLLDL